MWTRALLKANAKTVLRRSYWRVFLMCLIASLLAGDASDLNFNLVRQPSIRITAAQATSGWAATHGLPGPALRACWPWWWCWWRALCWGILFSPVIRVGAVPLSDPKPRPATVGLGHPVLGFYQQLLEHRSAGCSTPTCGFSCLPCCW